MDYQDNKKWEYIIVNGERVCVNETFGEFMENSREIIKRNREESEAK